MAITSKNVDGIENHELDFRALSQYLTVLDDGDVRARAAEGLYTVTSESGKTYLVEPDLEACECEDHQNRNRNCKHIRRVKFATGRREIPDWISDAAIDPQLGIHVDEVQDGVDRGEGVETDGGRVEKEIRVGDVCLDLAQGRPVHVIEDTGQNAAEWSDANNYEITENYGNSRLGSADDDRVYDVVYCSSAKSEPSKSYGMPESRLLRIETEAADDGRPVADRAVLNILEQLFDLAMILDEDWAVEPDGFEDALSILMANHSDQMTELGDEAQELADVTHRIGGSEVSWEADQ